jgi:N6-L-threonylcarbamoyladenine synthase
VKILAIETSLDDTCAAVINDDRVMSNVVASQTAFHEEWGGTVPHIAKRKHLEWIDETIWRALKQSRDNLSRDQKGPGKSYPGITGIDAVAVTYGPGLAPCLEVGIAKAKELAKEWQKPLIAVNHLEGHLLSSLAKNSKEKTIPGNHIPGSKQLRSREGLSRDLLPALGFLISGGHTELVLVKAIGKYELLGETLDDAAGEAYDKVARMLQLGYPGGPILSELAKSGNPKAFPFPEPMRLRKDLNFSFSGIKTAALYKLRTIPGIPIPGNLTPGLTQIQSRGYLSRNETADFAASFQAAVMKMLMRRLKRAIELYQPKTVLLGGGVVSNVAIRTEARRVARKYDVKVMMPYNRKLFTDNAAMIGVAAWYKAQRGEFVKDLSKLDREPNLNF